MWKYFLKFAFLLLQPGNYLDVTHITTEVGYYVRTMRLNRMLSIAKRK